MSPRERKHFDRLLDEVVERLPAEVLELMDEVPLVVEDYASEALCKEVNVQDPDELCGLFRGIAITEPEDEHARQHSNQVLLFREGVLAAAMDEDEQISDDALRQQIRITILHEYGHHFGLDEEELDELGYG
jgi:predicted Zn-dependent protease with MMP-like domain